MDIDMDMVCLPFFVAGFSKSFDKYRDFSFFTKKVYLLLLENIKEKRENPFCIKEVCCALNVSERTFYRRIKDSGTSYYKIKDDLRKEISTSLLSSKKYKVKDIYHIVGFKSSSSFIQSFKRWHGCSPKKWMEINSLNLE